VVQQFDIAVVGAGLVGASLALALQPSGLSVALIEPRAPDRPQQAWDSRVYAISPGSASFLADMGAWQDVDPARIGRVEAMRIYGDDAHAELRFSAYDAGLRELAHIAESGRMQMALWQCLARAPHLRVFCPAQCESLTLRERHAELTLQGGTPLHARLVVGADGAQSWVREAAGIQSAVSDYHQCGVVANFACARPHHGTAFQWFRDDGVLALLPLPGNHVSLVWSTADSHAQALCAMPALELAQCVGEASHEAVGALEVVTPAAAFALRLRRVAQFVTPRLALVGDAAHNVHPLAGQGVNLGFRDARELAQVLCDRGPQNDCGDYALLRRYERARKEDVLTMQLVTDGLQKLFASPAAWWGRLRNGGMRVVDGLPALKSLLIRHAAA
jgi:ubiquinone biosynthesis UbiH/UbiF/VisC/COQ6 family hydroxylase